MFNMRDIYLSIDKNLLPQGFWQTDMVGKKKLIDQEMRIYLIEKIEAITGKVLPTCTFDLSVLELVTFLAEIIPADKHEDSLRHTVHYILNVAGSLQGKSIPWWGEDNDELIDAPLITFDADNNWDDLKTHPRTDYVSVFAHVYDIFTNQFMITKAAHTKD